MSGSNVQVDVSSQVPSAPVGGADALAPLTAAIDNLHAVLVSVKEAVDKIDIGGAIKGPLSNELSAFTSSFKNAVTSFETVLLRFTNNFVERLDGMLSNIRVTARGGRSERRESRRDKETRIEREVNLKQDYDEIRIEREVNLKQDYDEIRIEREANIKQALKDLEEERKVRTIWRNGLRQYEESLKKATTIPTPYSRSYLKNGDADRLSVITPAYGIKAPKEKYTTIPSPYNNWYKTSKNTGWNNFVTPTGTDIKPDTKFTSTPSPYSRWYRKDSDKEWNNYVSRSGSFRGTPKPSKVPAIPTPYNRDYLRYGDKDRNTRITPSFGVQPPKPPKPPTTAGAGGFDWKKLLGAAGLGFAFTGGAGVAAAAIVKLMPKVVKAFEPVIDLGNALVDSLDPLAETINSALTPFRDLANQLKRFSVLGGFGASFNMNRINAQFESNLNDLMGSMLETVSSIFSNPLAGIMNAASMIGKFVDMVDPAAMALFQQTMRDTFAVIGTALRPAMFELSKMLRSFADHLHPVLQGAMPRIMSGLQSLAEAFERNIPLITLMIERFLGDMTKQVDKSGSLFGEDLKPEKLFKALEDYNKSLKEHPPESIASRAGAIAGGGFGGAFAKPSEQAQFEKTLNKILTVAGKSGGIEQNKEFLANFLKNIVDRTKPASTVGLARVTDAAYSGVAEVGREAVRRAFEGSRLQDLQRQNNREDIETATYNAFIKALEQWSSGGKIYAGPEPEGIHSGTQFYPKPVR